MNSSSLYQTIIKRRSLLFSVRIFALLVVGTIASVFLLRNAMQTMAYSCSGSGSSRNCIVTVSQNLLATDLGMENTNVEINSGVTLIVYGSHTFRNLILHDGAIITHSALSRGTDYSTLNWTLTSSGLNKKVDITITNDLIMEGSSSINVDGKGYQGGSATTGSGGDGPGAGIAESLFDNVAGGGGGYGGHGAAGGHATGSSPWVEIGTQGKVYSGIDRHGSGGGWADDTWGGQPGISTGGPGGGVIKLLVGGTLNISDQASLSSNGNPSPDCILLQCGGGGSGGSINVTATNFINSGRPYEDTGPRARKGDSRDWSNYKPTSNIAWDAADGIVTTSSPVYTEKISANGGSVPEDSTTVKLGAGGGGGMINISFTNITNNCRIDSVSNLARGIPSVCEYKDVIIDSTPSPVMADLVKLRQDLRGAMLVPPMVCTDAPNQNCDSKRIFNSLTLRSNAILSHSAIGESEVGADENISNDTSGTGRWKKVDIITLHNITLLDSSKIDVSGSGYPGGTTTHVDGYGRGGGSGGTSPANSRMGGGGGAHEGDGGNGKNKGALSSGAVAAGGTRYDDDKSNPMDYGSGGGAFRMDGNWGLGGQGGGLIVLISENLIMSTGSSIISNGSEGTTGGGGMDVSGGGGAGGSINITLTNGRNSLVNFPLDVSSDPPLVNLALASDCQGMPGWASVNEYQNFEVGKNYRRISSTTDGIISAKGVATYMGVNTPGSGGGGIISIKLPSPGVGVKKTLSALERPVGTTDTTFNPYALQKNDKIRVSIVVPNLQIGQSLNLSDNFLSLSSGSTQCSCQNTSPSAGDYCNAIPTLDFSARSDGVDWTGWISSVLGEATFSYSCVVK